MYEGMAYIALYKNKACTQELEKDNDGNYIYTLNKISSNAYNPCIINIYVKNIGSHTAYDFTVSLISTNLSSIILTKTYNDLLANQVDMLKASIELNAGEVDKMFVLKIGYDNV